MNIYRRSLAAACIATSLGICAMATVARAQDAPETAAAQEAQRVQDLLAQLHGADDAEASQIQRELVLIWSRSGSPSMDLLLRRGEDAMAQGDYVTAISHLSALVDHAPDFAEAYHQRARAFYQEGEMGLAMEDLARALSLNPYNYEAAFGIAMILEQTGRVEAAYHGFRSVLAIYPGHEGAKEGEERLAPQVSDRDI